MRRVASPRFPRADSLASKSRCFFVIGAGAMQVLLFVALVCGANLAIAIPVSIDRHSLSPIDALIAHAHATSAVCPNKSPPPPPTSAFPCSPYPHTPASSVHKLTPYDIGVVAAMGDSITAAFAACAHCIVEIVEECRGASWSIGGVGDFSTSVTLPNILKHYNGNLTGFSTGSNIAKLPGMTSRLSNRRLRILRRQLMARI
jgi:hypothetical protein